MSQQTRSNFVCATVIQQNEIAHFFCYSFTTYAPFRSSNNNGKRNVFPGVIFPHFYSVGSANSATAIFFLDWHVEKKAFSSTFTRSRNCSKFSFACAAYKISFFLMALAEVVEVQTKCRRFPTNDKTSNKSGGRFYLKIPINQQKTNIFPSPYGSTWPRVSVCVCVSLASQEMKPCWRPGSLLIESLMNSSRTSSSNIMSSSRPTVWLAIGPVLGLEVPKRAWASWPTVRPSESAQHCPRRRRRPVARRAVWRSQGRDTTLSVRCYWKDPWGFFPS